FKVGAQLIGGQALCRLNQPPRVSHQHRLISCVDSPELVEQILHLREPAAGTARAAIPETHTEQLEAPYDIQVEQRVRISKAAIATRPPLLLPQIEAAHRHLRRVGRFVVQARDLAGPESRRPMRAFQLTSETGLKVRHASECEEAVLEQAGEQRTVLQV